MFFMYFTPKQSIKTDWIQLQYEIKLFSIKLGITEIFKNAKQCQTFHLIFYFRIFFFYLFCLFYILGPSSVIFTIPIIFSKIIVIIFSYISFYLTFSGFSIASYSMYICTYFLFYSNVSLFLFFQGKKLCLFIWRSTNINEWIWLK